MAADPATPRLAGSCRAVRPPRSRAMLADTPDDRRAGARDRHARRGRRPHAGDRRGRRGRRLRRARAAARRGRALHARSARSAGRSTSATTACSSSIDPIDGSLNAKRGLPHHCALDRGRRRADDGRRRVRLRAGLRARRGVGRVARRAARSSTACRSIPTLGERRDAPTASSSCSASSPPTRAGCVQSADALVRDRAPAARDRHDRRRRCARSRRRASTGWLTLKRCRAVDAAAAQLIVREAGGLVAFTAFDDPLGAPLDLAAALAGGRRAHAAGSRRRRARLAELGRAACHPGQGDRLEARRAPWPAASPNLQPAGDPAPFEQLAGPAAESERLVSAYTGLVPR